MITVVFITERELNCNILLHFQLSLEAHSNDIVKLKLKEK